MNNDKNKTGLTRAAALTFFFSVTLIFVSFSSQAQSRGPARANKDKSEQVFIDPLLKNVQGQLSFDDVTKAALERANKPGVLVAAKEEPKKIYRIELVGAKKIELDAVALRLKSKIGQEYSALTVSEDISEIYQLGFFSDVSVYYNELPSGAIVLRYVLEEIPTIFQIKIVGNDHISTDEIKESISTLQNYQGAKLSRLRKHAKEIEDFYQSKGYYLAMVDVSIKNTDPSDIKKRESEGLDGTTNGSNAVEIDTTKVIAPDFVDVIFSIRENHKVKIDRITLLGNKRLDEDIFREGIRSHENHFLSVLTDWGTFRKDFIEVDELIILEKMLHDHGLLKASILPAQVELSSDKSSIHIGFRIVEGEQYYMGDAQITGDKIESSPFLYDLQKKNKPDEPLFLGEKLLEKIELKKGDVFNKSKMAENVLAIAEEYRDVGYAYVNVAPIPIFNETERLVDIKIEIESGPLVGIERIYIEGNEKTKDEVIRRELNINEGDLYSSTLLKISEQNVQRLGYFESVEFTNSPGSADDKMVIAIKVKEQSTDSIQLSAGYGTGGEGIVLRGQLTNRNLFGRGQTLMLSVNYSSLRRMFDVSFIEPYAGYVFDNPLSFAFTAYNRKMFLGEFNKDSIGGDVTLGYPIGGPFQHISRKWKQNAGLEKMYYVFDFEALWFYMTYTLERVEINDLSAQVRKWDLHQGVPRYTASLKPALRLDQRDNRMHPTRGIYFEARTEFASGYFGSSGLAQTENYFRRKNLKSSSMASTDFLVPKAQANNFIRFGTNFRVYHNLDPWFFLKGFVFKTNLELGVLNTLGEPLVFENYALGGIGSVRGYSYRSLSPVDRASALFPFDARRDVRIGGNKQFFGSMELEFPLLSLLKLRGVLFFDFGNVFAQEDNFFYAGKKSQNASRIRPYDPLKFYDVTGLYTSTGFGFRWDSPLGYLRFEFGFPLNPRPAGTPGLTERDPAMQFEFSIGPSF